MEDLKIENEWCRNMLFLRGWHGRDVSHLRNEFLPGILCIDFLTFIYYKGGKIAAVFLLKRIPFGYDGESCDTFKDKKVFYGHGGMGELGRNEARNSIPDEDDVM